ncbi:3-oxoacyl-ACP synthase III family protein [Sabulicella rubraurantiaca]|uniref:3-oxoacyl-ACP synthase III family protein n=1 Tax=Sabulicella rubraurantiaca TaxID=2811429 RepID=UPI001A95E030|nr:hypothetical protein [Sabulicella rubraurantiaca]
MTGRIGIIGLAHKLPDLIRGNDDPIFDWLKKNSPSGSGLFVGYGERHVLAPNESVLDILLPAARMALDDAGAEPGEIDHLIGCVSPSTYEVPSDLFALAARLGLTDDCLTIPLANDFSNFNVGVALADALLRSGRARKVLVAVGGGWTRAVDYHTPQAASVGDGAAAAVLGFAPSGKEPRWELADSAVVTREGNFGEMVLTGDWRAIPGSPPSPPAQDRFDPKAQDWTGPYFHISAEGLTNFPIFGGGIALQAAQRVMQRQGIASSDVTLICHQVSQKLLDMWRQAVAPALLFDTLLRYGNMTVANIPVNLSLLDAVSSTPWTVALSLAPDMHAHALLLRRARPGK